MIAYAAKTTNIKNRAALQAAGWRIMLSPATGINPHGLSYALDNGSWSAFTSGKPWSEKRFVSALLRVGRKADFVCLPDIVEGGMESLLLSLSWRDRVLAATQRALIPVQDGMSPDGVRAHLSPRVGIFVGGSTDFKESTMAMWASVARESGSWCHVGRVNTARRIALCAAARVDSFDGSSASKYSITLPLLDNARKQPDMIKEIW